MTKKICVVTGSRAEYGLFYPLLQEFRKQSRYKTQLIVTGAHLVKEFGKTAGEIRQDGLAIDYKVDMNLISDTPAGVLRSMGKALAGFARAYGILKPDLVILLGDRYETFCAAVAAHLYCLPIAHLHGGELSEGAIDDAFRHAITKMSQLHFTGAEVYRKRVIQLGEEPNRVYNVGALGIDNIKSAKYLSQAELQRDLGFAVGEDTILLTYHPVTLEQNTAKKQIIEILTALQAFPKLKVIFTKPNADTYGRVIIRAMEDFVRQHQNRAAIFSSLGRIRYLSALNYVGAVVGNSSSGIIEAPSFGKPTVNIGDRQKGRLRAKSVIDCPAEKAAVIAAIKKAFSTSYQAKCKKTVNPYGNGQAAPKIVRLINANWNKLKLKKSFYDLRGVNV